MPTDWINKTIGNCRIEEKIGEGGCGQVFRGVDLMLDRRVAIKLLHPKLAGRLDVAERFRHEAHAMAKLSHPNVATLYSFHRESDNYLMIMEYVEGSTFEALLKKGGPMTASVAIPLLRQALAGVGHAHRAGILHRDLKATNLMLNEAGVVKVMDFGIAQALGAVPSLASGDSDASTPTAGHSLAPSAPVGTPEYMSPEQARGESLGPAADVYALGVLLFKLLTGRLPIRGDTPAEVMRAQIERAPRSIRSLAPGLPEPVALVVERAMEKTIDRRFADAASFSEALEQALLEAESCSAPGSTAEDAAQGSAGDPDVELGPTQLMWETRARPHPWFHRPAIWGPVGALLVFGLFALWLGQTGGVRATPAPGAEQTTAQSRHRLPPLEALPPAGFSTWPDEEGFGIRGPGPLGPRDFGVIPVAPSLPEPIAATPGDDPVQTPPVVAETPAVQVKKERAQASAKPQNRRTHAEHTPPAPAAQAPPSEPGPSGERQGRSGGWVIRR